MERTRKQHTHLMASHKSRGRRCARKKWDDLLILSTSYLLASPLVDMFLLRVRVGYRVDVQLVFGRSRCRATRLAGHKGGGLASHVSCCRPVKVV
ncbi:hypothetical protein EVAR_66055_1 [Eumeta japonica]|uniref:Uncharacterized protein n=1 Tax=Eumeta variegata TaxID=151549 RepID=A0A4C1ZJS8_EUMVA|nr:hypothetical protein EVAR_66055_1 [Eumeta japonica]